METNQYLKDYYNRGLEDGRLTTKYGLVEFLTTMRYIEKYLKQGDRILEIGTGTGRYAHTLARKKYTVDAVELIEHNIEIFQKNTEPEENITITQGDAVNLTGFKDNTYDITLLLGPMYHIFTEDDKKRALSEAIRVTKSGGVIFAAYCISDPSILDYGFKQGHVFELIEKKMLETNNFTTFSNPWDIFELYRKEDIDNLLDNFAVSRLHYVSADGYANHMREVVENMDAATFDLYLKYHFTVCERKDMVGLTHHALDIFRKN